VELCWNEVRMKLFRSFEKADPKNKSFAFLAANEPLTIVPSGPRLRRQRGRMRNRRVPLTFKLKSQRGAEKLEKESDVKENGIALTRDVRSAYEKIHGMINASKDEVEEVLIRVGNAGIKLHHDIFEEVEQSESEEADDDEKRVTRRRKAWKKSEVEAWKEGNDFDWKFNPFWRTEDTERFRDLLVKKEFVMEKTVDHFMELKSLINKEWIYFVF